jgi:uncharacterized Fe-S radical SAM superfamily protein PflX
MMVDSLKTYYEVSLNKRESKCKIASQTSATNSETLKSLWNEHQKVLKRMKNGNSSPEACLDFSFMDLKIKIARYYSLNACSAPGSAGLIGDLKLGSVE